MKKSIQISQEHEAEFEQVEAALKQIFPQGKAGRCIKLETPKDDEFPLEHFLNEIEQKRRTMKKNEYKCAMCGDIFEKGWTDEEAMEECKNNFGEEMAMADDNDTVCDDCYQKIK